MRVPNACWITQRTGGALFHREDRVRARVQAELNNDHGETFCGLKLLGDRRRMNDLPMHRETDVCRKCQQGYVNQMFPPQAFAR